MSRETLALRHCVLFHLISHVVNSLFGGKSGSAFQSFFCDVENIDHSDFKFHHNCIHFYFSLNIIIINFNISHFKFFYGVTVNAVKTDINTGLISGDLNNFKQVTWILNQECYMLNQ